MSLVGEMITVQCEKRNNRTAQKRHLIGAGAVGIRESFLEEWTSEAGHERQKNLTEGGERHSWPEYESVQQDHGGTKCMVRSGGREDQRGCEAR